MPVKIPADLPAAKTLQEENIFVMSLERAPAADSLSQPDADQSRHRDAVCPRAGQYPAAN